MSDICMLAHKFMDHKQKIKYPVIVQPKIDGVRMVWQRHVGSPITRNGKRIYNIEHIVRALESTGLDMLDGEIYHPSLTFEQINGLVRRSKNTCETELQYWIFDSFAMLPTANRLISLEGRIPSTASPILTWVPFYWVHSEAEIWKLSGEFISQGFEGAMIRNPESFYQTKRTKDLLKLKPGRSSRAVITGWTQGKGKHEGRMGTLIVQSVEPGESWTCEVGTGFSDHERDWSYVRERLFTGRQIKVLFQEFTANNIPRFPVYGGLSNDLA
jgi:DNA ligase-1